MVSLQEDTWYSWRARAYDGIDYSPWMSGAFFYVNQVNDPPQITIVEPTTDISTQSTDFLIQWDDSDPDSDANIALYYDTDNSGLDGTLIISGIKEDPEGEGDSYLWDLTNMESGTYYLYAVISDGTSSAADYSQGSVTKEALTTYYRDNDLDGCGDPNFSVQDYTQPGGFVDNSVDCDDSDPNVNPKNIEAITIQDEHVDEFPPGPNLLKVFTPSCSLYTTHELLSDHQQLGRDVHFQHRNPCTGKYEATYWFFDKISGKKTDLSESPPCSEIDDLYLIF